MRISSRLVLAAVLAAYVLFIVGLAWLRFPAANPRPNWIPFRTIVDDWRTGGRGFVVNFVGNIVAFLPMGFVPPFIRRSRVTVWQIAAFSLAFSLLIETGQLISGRRVPDVDDLILNTVGGVLGFTLAYTLRRFGRAGLAHRR
jgi:glycopeptide antibiotics resistance protein